VAEISYLKGENLPVFAGRLKTAGGKFRLMEYANSCYNQHKTPAIRQAPQYGRMRRVQAQPVPIEE
jgi:hypothetical protein